MGSRRSANSFLFSAIRLLPWVSIETISGPNSLTRQTHSDSGIPSSVQCTSSISSTWVAASTAQPAGKITCSALNFWQPSSVSGPIPPLPTTSFTPVCSINSRSKLSIRILVVGPTETISHLSPFLRTMGPAWKIALPLRS
ncbi:Uncharacterised protein [Shigella sonnei]|nr:Uncharacterised protein [Shigella sonnei]